ncbi:dihydroorotase [Caldicellulosiruptoraceae bacterium PP1]
MLLIKNVNYFDYYSKQFKNADVLIDKEIIVKIDENINENNVNDIIDAKGMYAVPPFVDCHCHLRDPGYEYKEDIMSGAISAINGGFGTICCMPNTNPVIDNQAVVAYINYKSQRVLPLKVYPIGAITKGLEGQELAEIGFMKEEGIVGLSDDGKCVLNSSVMRNALLYAKNFDLPVLCHCEDTNLSEGGQINYGIMSTFLGFKGIPREAETIMVARDIILAKETKAKVHITHVSTKESVELIRKAKEDGIDITADTCPHYISLTEQEVQNFNTLAKINPPLRTEDDIKALQQACLDGTIDIISTDHAPHHIDEKNLEFDKAAFGTIGFDTAFSVLNTYLIKDDISKLIRIIDMLTYNPSKLIQKEIPIIEVNNKANLLLLNLKYEFEVNNKFIMSKAKNNVFLGKKLKGVVDTVILNGKVMKRGGEVCSNIFQTR